MFTTLNWNGLVRALSAPTSPIRHFFRDPHPHVVTHLVFQLRDGSQMKVKAEEVGSIEVHLD